MNLPTSYTPAAFLLGSLAALLIGFLLGVLSVIEYARQRFNRAARVAVQLNRAQPLPAQSLPEVLAELRAKPNKTPVDVAILEGLDKMEQAVALQRAMRKTDPPSSRWKP